MKKIIIAFLLLLFLIHTDGSYAESDEFVLCYIDRYPYYYKDGGSVSGLIADVTDYAFKKSGFSYKWKDIPIIRMMVMLKENSENVVMPGWFKNPERELIGKFSIPVYKDKPYMIIARKDNEKLKKIKSFKELLADKSAILLVKDGYSYGRNFDALIKKNFTNFHMVTVDMVKMVQMINAGRGDYMFTTQEEGEYLVKMSGIERSSVVLKSLADSPEGENRYIIFSKKVSDEEIKIINRYILEYQKIQAK